MKVALVHMRHASTGGTERYLNHLARYLAERDHQVTIVCRRHETVPHPAVRFETLRGLVFGPTHRMWGFARAVEQYLARTDYDVVFGLGKTWTHDVVRLGGGCHQTYVDRIQNAPDQPRARRVGRRWLRTRLALAIEARALAPGRCLRVATNSKMVKQDVMQRYRIPADRITVIHNGVDLEHFHPRHRAQAGVTLRRAYGFQPEHIVVVFLGTGYHRKGLDQLLAVFPAFLQQRPEARLLVAGYESGLAQWQARATRLGLHDAVCFLGGRRDPEVCYAAGDLYVLPTRYDPFANSTLEALASGLPVITTDANGGAEIMASGVHGAVLQDRNDQHALLRELLHWTDRARLRQTSRAVRKLAEGFGIEREMAASTQMLLETAVVKNAMRRQVS